MRACDESHTKGRNGAVGRLARGPPRLLAESAELDRATILLIKRRTAQQLRIDRAERTGLPPRLAQRVDQTVQPFEVERMPRISDAARRNWAIAVSNKPATPLDGERELASPPASAYLDGTSVGPVAETYGRQRGQSVAGVTERQTEHGVPSSPSLRLASGDRTAIFLIASVQRWSYCGRDACHRM